MTVRNFEIYVDVFRQKKLLESAGFFDFEHSLPTFPLNTDGIDPKGSDIHIYNGKVTNFDDGIVFKPCRTTSTKCRTCSSGYVHDIEVVYSVGMSIGSVPPHNEINCVQNVTFENIHMLEPLKGIYVKTNPGTTGRGIIDTINYINITMEKAVWWPLWVGPQQMSQPDGSFLGCDMLYPFTSTVCPTNPLVDIRKVSLINVTSTRAINPYAGALLCDATNPCTDFIFENVLFQDLNTTTQAQFIAENLFGTSASCVPDPMFPVIPAKSAGRILRH